MFTSGLKFYEALRECETQNSVNINVFSHRNSSVILVRKSKEKFAKTINLFLIHNAVDPKFATKQHMSVIYDFNKFMFQTKTHHAKAQFCQLCFRRFGSPETLNDHMELCRSDSNAKQNTPKQGTFIQFDSWHSRLQYPYICTYSIQYFSVPVASAKGQTQFKRIPSSFSLCVFKNVGKGIELLYTHYVDSGDLVKLFWESVGEISQDVLTRVRTNSSKIVMTEQDKIRHAQATHCDLCSREFTVEDRCPFNGPPPAKRAKSITKVADHDHSNSESPNYRHTLCVGCNNRLRMKSECVFINFNESAADNLFLLKGLNDPSISSNDVSILAKNEHDLLELRVTLRNRVLPPVKVSSERDCKYWCGSRYPRARFLSATRFLQPNMKTVIENLISENDPCLCLYKQAINLLYPYHAHNINSSNIFNVNFFPHRSLSGPHELGDPIPLGEMFFDDIEQVPCSSQEYSQLLDSLKLLDIDNMGSLQMFYSYARTLTTAVCWASFSRMAFETYELEVATFPTVSSFAFQAMMYKTKARIDMVSDSSMQQLTSEIRPGLITSNKRLVYANHEGLGERYDQRKQQVFLFKADCNALFPHIMSNYGMPYKNYKPLSSEQLAQVDFADPEFESKQNGGIIACVDLSYPPAVQTKTLQLPLAVEKRQVILQELGPEQQEKVQASSGKVLSAKRLILSHTDKQSYCLDGRILSYYLSQGMQVTKFHGGFSFETSDFLKKFMQMNFDLRNNSPTESAKLFFKLISNSIWGMCGRSIEGHMKVSVCKSRPRALRHVASSRFAGFHHIGENTSLIFQKIQRVSVNKPRAIAFCVSDLSKLVMYRLLNNVIPNVFPTHEIILADTDGWTGMITGLSEQQVWSKFYDNKVLFDFSPLDPNSAFMQKYPELLNYQKGVPGRVKLESLSISSIVTPRPKCSSTEYYGNSGIHSEVKCSGVKQSSLRGHSHQEYIDSVVKNLRRGVHFV